MDFILFYVPSPKIIETYAAARGGNALGLANRDKDLIGKRPSKKPLPFPSLPLYSSPRCPHTQLPPPLVAFITPRWLSAAYDEIMFNATQTWADEAKKATEALGTDDPFLYQNFATAHQKPLCGYGPDNVRFLQDVSARYDPSGVFQTLVPGGFKVSKAC